MVELLWSTVWQFLTKLVITYYTIQPSIKNVQFLSAIVIVTILLEKVLRSFMIFRMIFFPLMPGIIKFKTK